MREFNSGEWIYTIVINNIIKCYVQKIRRMNVFKRDTRDSIDTRYIYIHIAMYVGSALFCT